MKINLVEYIVKQIQQIQGELILNKAMASEFDEKIDEAFNSGDILTELLAIKDAAERRNDYLIKINYLEGKIDGYIHLLKELGFEI